MMSYNKIRTIIADDEPKARKNILRMLEKHSGFEVACICSDGKETLDAIRELNPDLVFLDIQMPEYNGFELLRKLEDTQLPKIVFVTAYDEFALQAFEVHAIDYLMKPFDVQRFETALEKVKQTMQSSPSEDIDLSVKKLLETIQQYERSKDKIMIKEEGKIFFLDTDEIEWIEASGNYIKIVTSDNHYMIRETMKNIKSKLDSKIFFRIHRSTIINIKKVKVIEPWFHGDYQVTLFNGTRLNMSRNYKGLLEAF